MNIYNRLGELIYKTNSLEKGWDGTYKNNKAPIDVYTYIIIIETEDGRSFNKVGTFTLIF